MQALYTFDQDRDVSLPALQKPLEKSIADFYPMYMFTLWYAVNICKEVNQEAQRRGEKHIKTAADENFSVRLFHNPIIQSLALNPDLEKVVTDGKYHLRFDNSIFRFYFDELKKTKRHGAYAASQNNTIADDKAILNVLFKNILWQSEDFFNMMEDLFPGWNDDEKIVALTIGQFVDTFDETKEKNSLKVKRDYPDEKKFGVDLLQACFNHFTGLENSIEPKLKNWDKERVALVDRLLLIMATAELLYFPNIPVKVTLNEYIEIAKHYSTPQSGHFINGILDNLVKDFTENNMMSKTGRGRIDS